MMPWLEAIVASPFFIAFFVVLAFSPFVRAFFKKLIHHQRKAEEHARAADRLMQHFDPPASWYPQDEIERLEVENNELRERVEELTHQLGSGGPYRSPGIRVADEDETEGECNCPCTGMCSEWHPPATCPCGGYCGTCGCDCAAGHDAPAALSLQRGPGGTLFAGLGLPPDPAYVGPDFEVHSPVSQPKPGKIES